MLVAERLAPHPIEALGSGLEVRHCDGTDQAALLTAVAAAADAVRRALTGDLVPEAVNLPGDITEEIREVKVLGSAALPGVLANAVKGTLTLVNAPVAARGRIPDTRFLTTSECPAHGNVSTVRGMFSDGQEISVTGTPTGPGNTRKLVGTGGYDVDLDITDRMLFLNYKDTPGMIGASGRILGEADINIAAMHVARDAEGGEAMVAMPVDVVVPPPVLAAITEALGTGSAHFADLTA
ncbi:hypothetical protein A6A06_18875 [Streptomyces sp. CB02923]|nr:hypothetical protein A6A06_18875 [Streptomyces sp. CB02923]